MKLFVFVLLMMFSIQTFGKDLGKIGHGFAIKEESFLEMVGRKLKSLDIEEHQKNMENIAKKRVEEPNPVIGLIRARENRVFTYDPTYVLEKDIVLPNGEIAAAKGTKVNPLDHMEFDRELYFVNGNDKEQLSWLKTELKKESKNEKRIILVEGRIFELEEIFGQKIYFDQFADMTKKFGIKAVPAKLEQDGKLLRIEEIKIAKE